MGEKKQKTMTFGTAFERVFDLVDVRWTRLWADVDIEFLIARSGVREFAEWMEEFTRKQISKTRSRRNQWSPLSESLIDGPLARRQDEGMWKFLIHGVRGADSEMQFDPLAEDDSNTHSEEDFRATVRATLESQREAGEASFRRLVMTEAEDDESYRRDLLSEEAKNFAARFAGTGR